MPCECLPHRSLLECGQELSCVSALTSSGGCLMPYERLPHRSLLECGQELSCVSTLTSSGGCLMPCERLPHRSLHARGGHRRLPDSRLRLRARGAVPMGHSTDLGDPLAMYSVSCTHELMVFQRIDDFWNMMLAKMKQIPKEESRLENKSRNVDTNPLSSWKTVTHAPQEAIAAMTQVGVQDAFSWKQKRREPLGANPVTGIMQASKYVSSIAAKA